MAGVLSRFSSATTTIIQQLKNSSNNEKHGKKHCFLVASLEEVVFGEGNCRVNRKLRADPA